MCERERQEAMDAEARVIKTLSKCLHAYMHLCVYIYVYICVHKYRSRESVRQEAMDAEARVINISIYKYTTIYVNSCFMYTSTYVFIYTHTCVYINTDHV